uniref:UBX domain-containing protein 4 n=2 Tax=Pararge aegeria TaxID=116150 RepID=S4PBN0_9NEOP
MDRRAVGQGVAELKKWQADQEMKQIQEERKREKKENNLARQRILEQIAQDRAERKAREQPLPAPSAPAQVVPPSSVGDSSGRARVQFKLPDGEAHTAHFDVTATLADVQRYVAENLQLTRSTFSLWTAFPRRELTEVDATLQELQLAPSAALLVLQRRTETVAATPNMFASIITFFTQIFTSMVLDPSYQLYSWLRSRFFPAPANRPITPNPPTNPPAHPTNPAGIRRRGNIHRVTTDRADDDDNNTWNGNSTQQM